jgi:hypothetical protein
MTATDSGASLQPDRLPRTRSVAALVLLILASLGVVLSLVGLWVRSTLFDTDSFMEVVEPSLTSEEVVTVLGDTISEQAITALDIEGRLETRLAAIDAYLAETLADVFDLSSAQRALLARADLPRLTSLAKPIAAPIEDGIRQAVDDLMTSEAFQENLPEAIAFAHRGVVALITQDIDDLENVIIADGEVRWNLLPLVMRAINYVFDEGILGSLFDSLELADASYADLAEDAVAQLGEALDTVLPEDFGQVTVMSEDELRDWQSIARTLNRTAILAVVVTAVLAVAALVVSRDKRRTLVQFALGSVVAVLITGIVQRNVVEAVNAAIPGPPEQAAVQVLFDAVFTNLRVISWVYIVVAAVVALSAHLAGGPGWLEALRAGHRPRRRADGTMSRLDGVVRGHRDAFVVGGIGVALLAWWRVGVNLASLLIIGLLLGAYLWYVSRLAVRSDLPESAEP